MLELALTASVRGERGTAVAERSVEPDRVVRPIKQAPIPIRPLIEVSREIICISRFRDENHGVLNQKVHQRRCPAFLTTYEEGIGREWHRSNDRSWLQRKRAYRL